MAEVFVSYATEDRPRARALAEALELRGWSVWWDRKIPLGQSFDNVIEEAIAAAKCVIVLWSHTSLASEWVRSEAAEGKRRGILVPVFLEPVNAPLAFRLLNGANLADWEPGTAHAGLDQLTERIAEILKDGGSGEKPVTLTDAGERPDGGSERRRLHPAWIAVAALVLLIAAYAAAVATRGPRPETREAATTSVPPEATSGKGSPGSPSDTGSFDDLLKILSSGGMVEPGTLAKTMFDFQDIGVHLTFIPAGPGASAGAAIMRVEPGLGQAAGLHAGDVITAVNGHRISTEDDVRSVLKTIKRGKSQYSIRRRTETLTVAVDCPTCAP